MRKASNYKIWLFIGGVLTVISITGLYILVFKSNKQEKPNITKAPMPIGLLKTIEEKKSIKRPLEDYEPFKKIKERSLHNVVTKKRFFK